MEGRESFEGTFRRVGASVRALAGADTPDVVQEAITRALSSGVSVEAEAWLRTVAKRVAIDRARRRREMPSGAPVELEKWMSHDGNPEEAVIRNEGRDAVRTALDALPPRYRRVLLAYAEEDSPAAVARRMGLSSSATWTLLSRARSRLKLQLDRIGYAPAMMMSRVRIRGIAIGGAAAAAAVGIATTVALIPSHQVNVPVARPAQMSAHVETVKPSSVSSPTSIVNKVPSLTPPVDVKQSVNDVASKVKPPAAELGVQACLGPPSAPSIKVIDVSVLPNPTGVVGHVVGKLPDGLRVLQIDLCP